MKPTTTHIFVRETERELKKNSFEYADTTGRNKTNEVVAVGQDVQLCKAGDHVTFTNGSSIWVDNEQLIAIDESDLLGVENV